MDNIALGVSGICRGLFCGLYGNLRLDNLHDSVLSASIRNNTMADLYSLDPPVGQVKGCLPRVTRYGECCDKFEDHVEVIPREKWDEYLDSEANYRQFIKSIFSQGSISSCASEATTQGMAGVEAFRNNGEYVLLNPWTLYPFVTTRDNGSNIDRNLERARDFGVLPEEVWPRLGSNGHAWNDKPPADLFDKHALRIKEFYDIGTVDEVGTALIKGFPVVFGSKGHAQVITSLRDRNTGEQCNSWNVSWGDKGFGLTRLNSINFGYGCFAIRTTYSMVN